MQPIERHKSEQLREALLDLERANAREHDIRLEAEALLSGLRALTDYDSREGMFGNLLGVLHGLIRFDGAFIVAASGDAEWRVVASTAPGFEGIAWARGGLVGRLSRGPLAFFDVGVVPEWQAQPGPAREGVCSALHVLLRDAPHPAILTCTHSSRGFFAEKHLRLAARFAPLASQALANYDYTLRLEQINETLKREVVERQRAEVLAATSQAQIVSSSKMAALGEMAAGMAHEINTPLATITVAAGQLHEFLSEQPLDLAEIAETATTIERTTKRIARIVSGLRSFSRSDAGDPLAMSPVKTLVEETLILCRERFAVQGIRLTVDEVSDDLAILCRPAQISQVILILLNNAYDAVSSLPEKWVTLSVIDAGDAVELSITDSGRGISDELHDKLFQPFYTTKDIGKGTGLGLSISRGLVEAHRGDLAIDASSPNTRFLVRLPKLQTQEVDR